MSSRALKMCVLRCKVFLLFHINWKDRVGLHLPYYFPYHTMTNRYEQISGTHTGLEPVTIDFQGKAHF